MSEPREHAVWWEPVMVFLIVVAMIIITHHVQRSELRDLQRRVGQLELRQQ